MSGQTFPRDLEKATLNQVWQLSQVWLFCQMLVDQVKSTLQKPFHHLI